jgi:hypothetical protein
MFKLILVGDCRLDLWCTVQEKLAGCCGHGDERSDSIGYGEMLD